MDIAKYSYFKSAKSYLSRLLKNVDPELWPVCLFFLLNLVIGQDKIYLAVVALLLLVLYRINKSFINSLWLTFLTTLPFGRGRFFNFVVIPKAGWGGNWDLPYQTAILFSDIILMLTVYVLFTNYRKYRNSVSLTPGNVGVYVSLLVFILISGVGTYMSQFPNTAFYYYIQLTKLVVIFLTATIVFSSKKMLGLSFKILTLFAVVNALLVVGQYTNHGPLGLRVEEGTAKYLYADENPGIYRPGGFSVDPNIAATIFSTLMPILLIKLFTKKKILQIVNWITVGLVTTALILTGGRSAWVVTIFSSAFIFWYLLIKNKLQMQIPTFFRKYWLVFLVPLFFLVGTNIIERMSSIVDIFTKLGGGTYRLAHLNIGWHYLTSTPFGIGVGTFPFKMALDFPVVKTGLIPNMAHNIFAEVGAETGILGLLSFFGFLGFLVRAKYKMLLKTINLGNFGFFMAFASFLLLSNFFPWFLHPRVDWLLWLLSAYGISKSLTVE